MRSTSVVPVVALLAACGDNLHPDEDQLVIGAQDEGSHQDDGDDPAPGALDVGIQIFPDSCDTPLVHFEASAGGDNLACLWNFDDGTTSTQCNGDHTFPEAGWHDFALRVIDLDTGASGSATQRRFVEFPLEATLDVSTSGLSISWSAFVNVSAFAIIQISPIENVISDDPDYRFRRQGTVQVSEPGTYTVTFDVEDERGAGPICSEVITKQITVTCADDAGH